MAYSCAGPVSDSSVRGFHRKPCGFDIDVASTWLTLCQQARHGPQRSRNVLFTQLLSLDILVALQVWIGYNQSLRPCQSGLTLNTDITAAAFLEGQPMLRLISGTVGMQNISGGLNPQQVRLINKAVRGVQVSVWGLLLKIPPASISAYSTV